MPDDASVMADSVSVLCSAKMPWMGYSVACDDCDFINQRSGVALGYLKA